MFLRIFYLQYIPQRTIIFILVESTKADVKFDLVSLSTECLLSYGERGTNRESSSTAVCSCLLLVEEPSPLTVTPRSKQEGALSGLSWTPRWRLFWFNIIKYILGTCSTFRPSIQVLKHEPGPLLVSALSPPLSHILSDEAGVEVV